MAAKSWEKDFRYHAMQASVKKFDGDFPDELFDVPESFCVPVGKRPVIGWTPGKTTLVALVLGFAMLFGAMGILSLVEDDAEGPLAAAITIVAVLCGVGGIGMFFLPLMLDRYIVAWCMGSRGGEFLRGAEGLVRTSEVSDTNLVNAAQLSIDGDDYVLIRFEPQYGRVLMEGISARYQIRAEDVLAIEPFVFINYLGAKVTFRIDDAAVLSLAIARVSTAYELTRQLPFLIFLRKRIGNRLYSDFQQWHQDAAAASR